MVRSVIVTLPKATLLLWEYSILSVQVLCIPVFQHTCTCCVFIKRMPRCVSRMSLSLLCPVGATAASDGNRQIVPEKAYWDPGASAAGVEPSHTGEKKTSSNIITLPPSLSTDMMTFTIQHRVSSLSLYEFSMLNGSFLKEHWILLLQYWSQYCTSLTDCNELSSLK